MRTAAAVVVFAAAAATAAQGYRTPPEPILSCVDAPAPPSASVAPGGAHLLLAHRESMPGIAALARPILRLGGLRIDPATYGPQRTTRVLRYELVTIADGSRRAVSIAAAEPDLGDVAWTADGRRFAFTHTAADHIELWVADVATAAARRVGDLELSATMGDPLQWLPDQRRLLCLLRVPGAPPPAEPPVPSGPAVQESQGRKAPVRTYQDLLRSPHDEAVFAHYTTAQLAIVDPEGDVVTPVGEPAIYADVSPSPDGRLLLTTTIERPFSYLVTARSFPERIRVVDLRGKEAALVARLPSAERVPIGGVRTGPRRVEWLASAPATLCWFEALDDGDPDREVAQRDSVIVWRAPFGEREEWLRTKDRGVGVSVAERGDLALITEMDWRERRARLSVANPQDFSAPATLVLERSTQDAYGDPGRPMATRDARGRSVLRQVGTSLLFEGRGDSPDGQRPFVDLWDLRSGAKERIFHCAADRYEDVVAPLADDASVLLVVRETPTTPPAYLVVDRGTGRERLLWQVTDPAAEWTAKLGKELIRYTRADGLELSGTLYLPPDHVPGERLPVLVWAYPREYGSADDAGQVRAAPNRYTRLSGTSPILLALAGYAVFDDAAMPIVGPAKTANDTFVEQLVADAAAAKKVLVERGVGDPDRFAIAGHSYGAFMTANLLAHSDLFRAGVARSGAYNRTLTPFGFQNERRTYWDAPEIYHGMSPFMHAPQIDEPILLIHGDADNNPGTFTLQSERLFHAIKGHGGIARLVLLPHESHGYRARESVLHCLAETVDWLDRYVKNAGARAEADAALPAAVRRR